MSDRHRGADFWLAVCLTSGRDLKVQLILRCDLRFEEFLVNCNEK